MPRPSSASSARTRTPLHRNRVLAEAVALADTEGLEAVSMRRLAERLGVVPMALYKHVADKDDLLDGMVDAVVAEGAAHGRALVAAGDEGSAPPGDPDAGAWAVPVRRRLGAMRAALQSHPWARRVIETRTHRTADVLAHMEAVTQDLLRGGFSPDLAHHAMHALGNRIWGFSPELFDETSTAAHGRAPVRPRTSPAPDPADYPGIVAVSTDARARRPGATGCDEDYEYAFALDLLLAGLERLRGGGWSSPGAPPTRGVT